ncbi:MAG: hypothetical protein H6524_01365 [Actinobacteria bacterium]|jgi:hypothetical protein|nr:hypothetical protein [Micrococcales bacterium]MCB0902879.1 hypothetical protein [Actinomycetota bacterium]MCO5298437.1 hypothetical protein [Candidatus Nanopelagicales bacterium]MCB9427439.1 hypothetical protein [Actinomycetota bacterium]HPQ82838.1 hypothetical protein [Actinomycetota bacterium]
MINPPPRPALRKAPDADVHPVAPMPSAVPAPRATPRPELRPVTGFGGRTSDTLVHRSKKVKLTTLEVKVPKRVAKAAKQKAKARGQRLDDVVGAALLNYVDGL